MPPGIVCPQSAPAGVPRKSPQGVLVFHMFSALAESERALIRERTTRRTRRSEPRGPNSGRPSKLTEDDLDIARPLLANPDIPVAEVRLDRDIASDAVPIFGRREGRKTVRRPVRLPGYLGQGRGIAS
jgi:DNA invertase Pin-like site-specific DNA recombinase